MCVLQFKPIFLPVDIQHRRCPCRFFKTTEIQALWTQNYGTDILHLLCSKQSRFCDGMPSYWIRQARHTHYMKGRKQKKTKKQSKEKTPETKRNKKLKRNNNSITYLVRITRYKQSKTKNTGGRITGKPRRNKKNKMHPPSGRSSLWYK